MDLLMASFFLILAVVGIIKDRINKDSRNEVMIWTAIVAAQVWMASNYVAG